MHQVRSANALLGTRRARLGLLPIRAELRLQLRESSAPLHGGHRARLVAGPARWRSRGRGRVLACSYPQLLATITTGHPGRVMCMHGIVLRRCKSSPVSKTASRCLHLHACMKYLWSWWLSVEWARCWQAAPDGFVRRPLSPCGSAEAFSSGFARSRGARSRRAASSGLAPLSGVCSAGHRMTGMFEFADVLYPTCCPAWTHSQPFWGHTVRRHGSVAWDHPGISTGVVASHLLPGSIQ